jgi:hypothetical protein
MSVFNSSEISETVSILLNLVGFEVLTAVVMKSTIFWDITPCSPLKVNWRFRGRISRARNHHDIILLNKEWNLLDEEGTVFVVYKTNVSVLTATNISMFSLEVFTEAFVLIVALWLVIACGAVNDFLQEYTASIRSFGDWGSMFLRNIGIRYKSTRCHNPE